VEGFDSDFGGTEIQRALAKVFASSPPDLPTVVFVLTDGEVFVSGPDDLHQPLTRFTGH
jgi:hypothetical protein